MGDHLSELGYLAQSCLQLFAIIQSMAAPTRHPSRLLLFSSLPKFSSSCSNMREKETVYPQALLSGTHQEPQGLMKATEQRLIKERPILRSFPR